MHETVPAGALQRAPERAKQEITAPFVVCSYYIETYSSTGDFPDPSMEGDEVIRICMTFGTLGTQDMESVLLCLGECADIEGADVECCDLRRT